MDNILILKRLDQQRVLSSVQRIGPDLEPTIVTMDGQTGRLACIGSKRQHDDQELADRILEALRSEPAPVTESYLQAHVEGRKADQMRVLRVLLGMGKVHRVGRGGKLIPSSTYLVLIQVPKFPVLVREPGT